MMWFLSLAVWFMIEFTREFALWLIRKVEFYYCKIFASQDKISDVTYVVT